MDSKPSPFGEATGLPTVNIQKKSTQKKPGLSPAEGGHRQVLSKKVTVATTTKEAWLPQVAEQEVMELICQLIKKVMDRMVAFRVVVGGAPWQEHQAWEHLDK